MTLYLEQYLDSLQGLPGELKRNLGALRSRDEESQSKLRELDQACKAYLKGLRSWGKEAKSAKYTALRGLFKEARALADDKVALAATTYEMVDRHIRRLDADLSRFEADIKRKFLEGKLADTDDEAPSSSSANSAAASSSSAAAKATTASNKKARKSATATPARAAGTGTTGKKRKAAVEEAKKGRKKARDDDGSGAEAAIPGSPVNASAISSINPEALAQLTGPALFQQLAGGGGEVMDMPVDPNEPTYCLCHQVSFGEMVGCDNPHCPVEWFHFACVGLAAKPKGKWFCPKCLDDRKKKAH